LLIKFDLNPKQLQLKSFACTNLKAGTRTVTLQKFEHRLRER